MLGLALDARATMSAQAPVDWILSQAGLNPVFSIFIAEEAHAPTAATTTGVGTNASPDSAAGAHTTQPDVPTSESLHEITVSSSSQVGDTSASVLVLGGFDSSLSYKGTPPVWLALLQQGQPLNPPSGWDLWRVSAKAAFVYCSQVAPSCITGVPKYPVAVPDEVDLCANDECTAIFASSHAHVGFPPAYYSQVIAAINGSCGNTCFDNSFNSSAFSPRWASPTVFCPTSCPLASMPNITLRLSSGGDGTSGPVWFDFSLVPAAYAYTATVPMSAPPLSATRIMLAPFQASMQGEADIILGLPFFKAFYATFDAGYNRGVCIRVCVSVRARESFVCDRHTEE